MMPWDGGGGEWSSLIILMKDISISPRILTWPYPVILTLGNSHIVFCNKSEHKPWGMQKILTSNHDL